MALVSAGLWIPNLTGAAGDADSVRLIDRDGSVRIEIRGELFAQYHYQGASRPFLYPVLGPNGESMTRNWPIQEADHEEQDHPHHRSLWYAHGDVNGHDFWSESASAGRTVHERFLELSSGPGVGVIRTANKLVARDGSTVGTDERTIRIHDRPGERLLDFEITLIASEGPLVLGDTKEGSFAIRLAESMRLKPNKFNTGKPAGHIVNSEGVKDDETWGRRARWVDYHGPIGDRTLGIAIFDHPGNPRHPTWWHVRDYGLFAANPFGIHDFEKKPKGAGNLTVPSGDRITFRYRILIHPGTETDARVAERYEEYARTTR